MVDPEWCSATVIHFNYGTDCWNLFKRHTGRISFFWRSVINCLPAFRKCVSHKINLGTETLFWKDNWIEGRAPMYLWPEDFQASCASNSIVSELANVLERLSFSTFPDLRPLRDQLHSSSRLVRDQKRWCLTGNSIFSVKSFYNF